MKSYTAECIQRMEARIAELEDKLEIAKRAGRVIRVLEGTDMREYQCVRIASMDEPPEPGRYVSAVHAFRVREGEGWTDVFLGRPMSLVLGPLPEGK